MILLRVGSERDYLALIAVLAGTDWYPFTRRHGVFVLVPDSMAEACCEVGSVERA